MIRSSWTKPGAIIVCLLGLATAIAYATIPDGGGVVHGCYNTTNGQLRVIDPGAGQACRSGEAPLDWNLRSAATA